MATYVIERRHDAEAIAEALDKRYPSYRHLPHREKHHRKYRIAQFCRATGAFLQYAKS